MLTALTTVFGLAPILLEEGVAALKAIHPKKSPTLKILLPAAILLTGIAAAWTIVQAPAEVAAKPPKTTPPPVETLPVKPHSALSTLQQRVGQNKAVRPSPA